jgi:hypothetical protein
MYRFDRGRDISPIADTSADDSGSWCRAKVSWLISSHAAHLPIKIGGFLVH